VSDAMAVVLISPVFRQRRRGGGTELTGGGLMTGPRSVPRRDTRQTWGQWLVLGRVALPLAGRLPGFRAEDFPGIRSSLLMAAGLRV
jgi:hypothetical protein